MRDLRKLPKAHLHLHLEGCIPKTTLHELASSRGNEEGVGETRTFAELDRNYNQICAHIQEPADLFRICVDLMQDEAQQGVVYMEPMVVPGFYSHKFGWTERKSLEFLIEALQAGCDQSGVKFGCIVGAIRSQHDEAVEATARLATTFAGRGVVAFGIAGQESANAHARFKEPCRIAKSAGLLVVPHAGEFEGPNSVWSALRDLNPDRLAHGVRAIEDPLLVAELANRRIPCDISLSSNLALGIVSSATLHPAGQLARSGVLITLNADDQTLFGSSISDQYALAAEAFGWEDSALARIACTSLQFSGASQSTIEEACNGIADWLSKE